MVISIAFVVLFSFDQLCWIKGQQSLTIFPGVNMMVCGYHLDISIKKYIYMYIYICSSFMCVLDFSQIGNIQIYH